MRFEELYGQRTESKLTQKEAARILGVSDRTFRRYCRSYEEEGMQGLYDERLSKPAVNAAPVDELTELLTLFETRYRCFNLAHLYDGYREEHKGERSYNWVKSQL